MPCLRSALLTCGPACQRPDTRSGRGDRAGRRRSGYQRTTTPGNRRPQAAAAGTAGLVHRVGTARGRLTGRRGTVAGCRQRDCPLEVIPVPDVPDLPDHRCARPSSARWPATRTRVALRTPGDAVSLTWREYGERVRRIAGGLHALGVRRGHTVGLMMTNRPEMALVDVAAMHLGAAPFSVYNTSTDRADRLPVRQRRQPGGGLRGGVPAAGAGGEHRPRPRRLRRRRRPRHHACPGSRRARRTASTSRRPGGPSSPTTWRR